MTRVLCLLEALASLDDVRHMTSNPELDAVAVPGNRHAEGQTCLISPMPWFAKTERFKVPLEVRRPHLEAHRRWVAALRQGGTAIVSGYLVNEQGHPGGGGLLLFEAIDHPSAEALVQQDPLIAAGCVDWQLQGWVLVVGDLRQVQP